MFCLRLSAKPQVSFSICVEEIVSFQQRMNEPKELSSQDLSVPLPECHGSIWHISNLPDAIWHFSSRSLILNISHKHWRIRHLQNQHWNSLPFLKRLMLPTSSRSLRDFSQVLSACGSIFAGLCQPCTHLPSTAVVYTSYLRISTTALMHSGGPEKVLSPLFGGINRNHFPPPYPEGLFDFPFFIICPSR